MTYWLLAWGNKLDTVINLTQIKAKIVFNALAERPIKNAIPYIVFYLQVRVINDPHGKYEGFTIHLDDTTSEDDIRNFFLKDPYEFKKLIRQQADKNILQLKQDNSIFGLTLD